MIVLCGWYAELGLAAVRGYCVVVSAVLALVGQDQVVGNSQRPERMPFDLAAELHLKFDAVAVAYRKAMRATGLAADR